VSILTRAAVSMSMMIRRRGRFVAFFNERQHRLGAPSSDQIMREQGINPIIPSLPKGVEFIDKETLDKAELEKMNISRSEA
jgi:hypothetical protein